MCGGSSLHQESKVIIFVKQGIKPPTTVLTNVLITIKITSKIMECIFFCKQEEMNTKEKTFDHCII